MSSLEFAAVVVILGVVATLLMQRLRDYQELAERADMEYVATLIKSALRVRVGTLMVEERMHESAQLVCENPFRWLAPPPANYAGERNGTEILPMPAGNWYFNRRNCTMEYWARRAARLQPDSEGQARVRYHVRPSALDGAGKVSGMVLQPVEPYRWQ